MATFGSPVERTCVELPNSLAIQLESKMRLLAQAQDLRRHLHQVHQVHQLRLRHITRIPRMVASLTKSISRSKVSQAVFAHLLAAFSSVAPQMFLKVSL